jgi:thioredoxin reductase (NADPH)
VSTGAQSLMLGLEASPLLGHGLSTCATCDGFFFRNQEIAVVGGGDSAIEEATFLTKFASKVSLIHRRDELRASKIMQDRALQPPKIEMVWNTVVDDLLGTDKLDRAVVRNVVTGESPTCPSPACSWPSATGPTPTCSRACWRMEDNGYLITGPGSSYTDVDGVFACGDVQDHTYRRPSRPPARAAWPPSTPSAGSRPTSTTDHGRPGNHPSVRPVTVLDSSRKET